MKQLSFQNVCGSNLEEVNSLLRNERNLHAFEGSNDIITKLFSRR